MDKLFTKEEANVLTKQGFIDYCNKQRVTEPTYERAYEKTETLHQQVHKENRRKYSDFSSYVRLASWKRQEA